MHSYTPEQELEVKFFPIDSDAVRKQLLASGAVIKTPLRTMRRVVFGSEANDCMQCTYGRVRDEGGIVTMSAKFSAANGDIGSQKEAMLIVDDFEKAHVILESFGLKPTNYQENKRETWQMPDETLVELELWPGLPEYLEIEGGSIEALRRTADKLGLIWEQHLTMPTSGLYAQHYDITGDTLRQKMNHLVF